MAAKSAVGLLFAFAAVCNTLHAAFALATPAALRFPAWSAELHPLLGATDLPLKR